jgi:tetratricopeptide (TPR) repeat protein
MRLLRGDRHPDVAVAVSNLADVLIAMGRHDEAEALLVESLEIRRAVFGDHHVETARSSRELAELYERMGRMELAARYRKAAEGGPEPAVD